ncbi:alcohol oxidase [Roridomyces roridus]|uniref:Alcohol oxidase n=1 Tax=Roridomyces roridus TaxID=1738132 RepID=A0AAD7G1Q7_9AGAR|nr:alcohol oxidase [Roridomyces roridus]
MTWSTASYALLLLFNLTLCSAVFVENVSQLNGLKFDFIVVGGGTAGNVIANRLTENPSVSVLVLEAGGSNADVLNIIVPFFNVKATPNTAQDWNFTTTPQVGLGNRAIAYPRGFVLGGSSSVNSMAYTRGSKDDYDRWAKVAGDSGWSWDNVIPYIRRNERFTPPPAANTTQTYDPAAHSLTGINSVRLPTFGRATDALVLNAAASLGQLNKDMNSGTPLGFGWIQQTVKNGSRSSSATSYLAPQFIGRPNLHVMLNTRVTRILKNGSGALQTVEFAQKAGGARFQITASKEVILSAGSIGTPSILLHSGIGDATELSQLGIPLVHNLPSVGKNLTDHPIVRVSWFVNSNTTFDDAERNATVAAEVFAQWNTTRTGLLSDSTSSQIGWLRLPESSPILRGVTDPSSGPLSPHIELIFADGISVSPPPTGHYLTISAAVVSPTSRGSLALNSTDPFAQPVINPNLLGSPVDVAIQRAAIRSAQNFIKAPAWAGYILAPFSLNDTASDEEVDAFSQTHASTLDHPVGTAAMSARGADYGVVDPDLIVKGLRGLRIVDASVFPFIPAAHTQAATYIVAERGADLIKASFGI